MDGMGNIIWDREEEEEEDEEEEERRRIRKVKYMHYDFKLMKTAFWYDEGSDRGAGRGRV